MDCSFLFYRGLRLICYITFERILREVFDVEDKDSGVKELYDINIRLNQPLKIGTRQYDVNETILSFERAEIAQITEEKRRHQATGGYNNNMLIDWEIDKQATFAISHGLLSPTTYAMLSNSKLNKKEKKSVSYREEVDVIEFDDGWKVTLKYIPNHVEGRMGLQGNPDNEPMPMGRRPWLPLKPLPPQRDRFLFCYDAETGQRIMNFDVYGNQIIFHADHRKVMVDYTFDYCDKIIELDVGNRLFNGFLNLSGKMTVKDYITGEPRTAIFEIPRLKMQSSISMRLGMGIAEPVVSDFYFIGYPGEGRLEGDGSVCKITTLETELTGDYV